MRRPSVRIGMTACVILLLMEAVVHVGHAVTERAPSSIGTDIFAQVDHANVLRDQALRSYESTRQYTVLEPGHAPDADLVVSMQFVAPSTKTFGKPSERGVGWIHKRVFHGLMNAEQEAASGTEKADSALSPANYDAQLIGEEQCQSRDCYVLSLRPKRQNKYLMVGKVWIDKLDLAIARIEGDPIKSPSFWVEHAHFVREYQRIGRFWLPQLDQTRCRIRFVGDYILRINYFDYKISARE